MSTPAGRLLASCHCGAIQLQVAALPGSYTICNCSTCRRYAARWLYFKRGEVSIVAKETAVGVYIWGDRMIKFCHCKTCGCLTHYEDVEQTPDSRVALNGNMLPPELLANLRVRKFDGADTFKEIE